MNGQSFYYVKFDVCDIYRVQENITIKDHATAS